MINNEKNIAFWDSAAQRSHPDQVAFAGMLMEGREFEAIYRCEAEQERLLTLFCPDRASRVLEVGSGGGRWALFFADRVGAYVGLDISPKMVAIADQERVRRKLSNVRFECINMLDFNEDEKFDMVFFSGVLQYMDDEVVEMCVKKASSLLSPGGVIISRDSVKTIRRVEKTGDYPVLYRTESEYRALFEKGGLSRTYSDLSYDHKRFTGMASRLYRLPGVTYGMASAFREALCAVDNLLGRPAFLKTRKHKQLLEKENPLEHRFFKFVRDDDAPRK